MMIISFLKLVILFVNDNLPHSEKNAAKKYHTRSATKWLNHKGPKKISIATGNFFTHLRKISLESMFQM